MTWNIWHGGREDGERIGPNRVVDVIRNSQADLVAMQETYGSGERISKALGFHFHPRGTNVSIHSRYPVLEDISVFEEFKCVGALIELPNKHRVAFYSIWLPYGADIWIPETRQASSPEQLQAACQPSAADLTKIHNAIQQRLSAPKYADTSIIIAGDFNSMSHLDYREIAIEHYERVVDWRTSHVLTDAGFRDSYREMNPTIDRAADATWSPRFPNQEQDRIDFIYYKSNSLEAVNSEVIREHADKFPSDHAAVLTTFRPTKRIASNEPVPIRTVTYNIHHAAGTDGELDLPRIGKVLKQLKPDVIGLQEVDFKTKRTNQVNQAAELGKQLNMHAAFGSFMNYQGGKYGLAVLSRYPIVSVAPIRLPDGNEPRLALAVEVKLPNNRNVVVVNLHFDWVADDAFRYQQAETLKEHLDQLEAPYLLLGDFNDKPGSRTLNLLSEGCLAAEKPLAQRSTWPSQDPRIEIDFLFASPTSSWNVSKTRVVEEAVASDHRPVFAEFVLRGIR